MKLPLVSIIVVDWNGISDTRDCLASIYRHCKELDWELIIIDNNEVPLDIHQLVSEPCSRLKIVKNMRNVGFAAACNQGFDVASLDAHYLLFLNNDTLLVSNFVSESLSYMESNHDVGATSTCIDYFEPKGVPWFHGAKLDERQGLAVHNNDISPLQAVEVPWLTGCSLLVRKKVFERAGKFDDSLFMYCEDVDLSIKLRKLGYRLVIMPEVGLLHKVSASAKRRAIRSLYYDVRNKFIMCKRHYCRHSLVPYYSVFRREVRGAVMSSDPLHRVVLKTAVVLLALVASLMKK